MFEMMHKDIHGAIERDLLHNAEMHRAYKVLKSRRKSETGNIPVFNGFMLAAYGVLKRLRNTADALVAPGRQGL